MKKIQQITRIFVLASFILILNKSFAQYYNRSKKNISFLFANTYSGNKNSAISNSIEFGKMKRKFLYHGGIGFVNKLIYKTQASDNRYGADDFKSTYNAIIGVDYRIGKLCLVNLSKKSFCKIVGMNFNIGTDLIKNLKESLNSDLGYRLKLYTGFYLSRAGSNKKDIGSYREFQLGYCYTDNNMYSNYNQNYHSIMLNILIIKHRLIKFADWY